MTFPTGWILPRSIGEDRRITTIDRGLESLTHTTKCVSADLAIARVHSPAVDQNLARELHLISISSLNLVLGRKLLSYALVVVCGSGLNPNHKASAEVCKLLAQRQRFASETLAVLWLFKQTLASVCKFSELTDFAKHYQFSTSNLPKEPRCNTCSCFLYPPLSS
jgi:hypothetical protein